MYISHKIYGHERGFSCCFRQPSAESHCRLLHGYSLSIALEFHAKTLDYRNWVVDFGGFDGVKRYLEVMFDHTLLVAENDPALPLFQMLDDQGVASLRIVRNVGCEAFAQMIFDWVELWMARQSDLGHAFLHKVTVCEHGSNGASYAKF